MYKGVVFSKMNNREEIAEDAHQCFYCTDFAYMSVVSCKQHKIHYCLYHDFMCGCSNTGLDIIYRYSTKELEQYAKMIDKAC